MRKIILGILMLSSFQMYAQKTQFEKFYHVNGNTTAENALQMVPANNGEIWMGGMKSDTFILRRVDHNGNLLYTKLIKADFGTFLTSTYDAHLVFSFDSSMVGGSSKYKALVGVDTSGKFSMAVEFDSLGDITSAKPTEDGGLVVATKNQNSYKAGFTKFSSKGTVDWSVKYNDVNGFQCTVISFTQTSDGGYLVNEGGYSGAGSHQYGLHKYDKNGNESWTSNGDYNINFVETQNSYVMLRTHVSPANPSPYTMMLAEYDKKGNLRWSTVPDSVDPMAHAFVWGQDLINLGNGYAMLTYNDSVNGGSDEYHLIRTDTSGNTLYFGYYGMGNSPNLFSLGTSDSSILIFGSGNKSGNPKSFYLIGVKDGNSVFTAVENESAIAAGVHVYPNPATSMLNIKLDKANGKTLVEIYDLTGRKVMNESMTGSAYSLDISQLNSGNYILKTVNNNSVNTIKVIKE